MENRMDQADFPGLDPASAYDPEALAWDSDQSEVTDWKLRQPLLAATVCVCVYPGLDQASTYNLEALAWSFRSNLKLVAESSNKDKKHVW